MRILFALLLALSLVTVTAAQDDADDRDIEITDFCSDVTLDEEALTPAEEPISFEQPEIAIDPTINDYYACIVTEQGVIEATLFDDVAPLTVNNFVFLAGEGFYDGVSFHRVIDEFMAQGGDRNGALEGAPGTGGPGYRFQDEPGALSQPHDGPGVLSMANSGPNSNGSQFFITHLETPWLNGVHAVFGQVSGEGDIDTLLKIEQGDLIQTIVIVEESTPLITPVVQDELETTDFCSDVSANADETEIASDTMKFDEAEFVIEPDVSDYYACIVTGAGIIELTLFDDYAPQTVNNFVFLAQQGFYDGVLWHRVVDDFVIQGGDRNGNIEGRPGTGGPGYVWDDEEAGLELTHNVPGVLSMANAGPDTNGSQFFITHVNTPHLNGRHAVFGQVSGEDALDIVLNVQQEDIIQTIVIIDVAEPE